MYCGSHWRAPSLCPFARPLHGQAKEDPRSSFTNENLRMVVADLFSAGMVTTSTTLAWALLLMILHPDVQREPSLGVGWDGGGRKGSAMVPELFGYAEAGS